LQPQLEVEPDSQPQLPQVLPQGSQQPQPQLWHLNMPQRLSQRFVKQHLRWQQHELQQLSQPQLLQPQLLQPQDCSQQQLFSQPQLCSQQPQPLLHLNMPQRLSHMLVKQHLRWQQHELQLLQPHDCSQQQLFSQPQDEQPHEGSQAQLFSQQPQQLELWKAPQSRSRMQQPPPPQQLLQPQLLQPQLCSQQQLFSQQLQLGSQQQPQPLPSILSNKQKPKLGLVRAMLTISAPKKFFIWTLSPICWNQLGS